METIEEKRTIDVQKYTKDCSCTDALKQGLMLQSFGNDSFSIYGSLTHEKPVAISYFGKLINGVKERMHDQHPPHIYLYYCFDNDWENKKILKLDVCKKSSTPTYCTMLNIEVAKEMFLAWSDDNGNWDVDTNSTYSLKVYPDIEKEILKRYGLDQKQELPTLPGSSNAFFTSIKELSNSIILFFKKKLFRISK